jgi:hypothetical protein
LRTIRYIVLPLILWLTCTIHGKTGTGDSRTQGLGGAGSMLFDDATAMPNPASLATLGKACLNFYAEDHFFVPELVLGAISLCLPTKTGTFRMSYQNYGSAAYQERSTSLAFGKDFGDRVRAGIEIDYRTIHQFAENGNLHAFIPVFGVQVAPNRQFILGFQLSNPTGIDYYPKGCRRIPAAINTGVCYFAGDEILVCFEFQKESCYKPVYCGGVEYTWNKRMYFCLGLSSSPYSQYSFGFGFRNVHLNMQAAVSHHPVLGYSPSITITCIR